MSWGDPESGLPLAYLHGLFKPHIYNFVDIFNVVSTVSYFVSCRSLMY
jgi:hypothetical protein